MKIKDLKEFINAFPEEKLENDVRYNYDDMSISGIVSHIEIAKEDLYYNGDDDPSPLYTKKQLEEMEYEKEQIAECKIEIHKGDFYFELG